MFRLTSIVLILFIAAAPVAAKWVELAGPQGSTVVSKVVSDNTQGTVIEFTTGGYNLGTTDINGKMYSVVTLPKAFAVEEKGDPELPTICKSMVIPDNAKMSYEILEAEYDTITIAPMIPSKGLLLGTVDPKDVPYTFSSVYGTNKLWPENVVELSDPYILRDVRGLTVHYNLFRTNAVKRQLVVCKRLVVRVYASGISTTNVKKSRTGMVSPAFKNIYDKQFINFSSSQADGKLKAFGQGKTMTSMPAWCPYG